MKKIRKFFLSPHHNFLTCEVYFGSENHPTFLFARNLFNYETSSNCYKNTVDITTHDLEFHSFLRLSHRYIVNKDSLDVKVEDMFEIDNPNI